MSSIKNEKQIKRRNKSFNHFNNQLLTEQSKQRRKSCYCQQCGLLSTLQYKHINLQLQISYFSTIKLRQYQSIESTQVDSQDPIMTINQTFKRITQVIQIKQQNLQNKNLSLIQTNQISFFKKQRSNSCYCEDCGNITKFQSQAKFIYIQKIIKSKNFNFRIKRNLDQMFKGISPIERKQEQDFEDIENDESASIYPNNVKSFRKSIIVLNQPIKQTQKVYQTNGKLILLKNTCQTIFQYKTNSNSRELAIKSDSNSPNLVNNKFNLPTVKSSYCKTRQKANEVGQHFKFTPKLNNFNLIS